MHSPDYTQTTVHEFTDKHPEASHVLRNYHVDVTASQELPLSQVAKSVTSPTDEILAVMEYRMRLAAKQSK